MSREKKPVIIAAERIHEVRCEHNNCQWDRYTWKRYRRGSLRDLFLKKALKLEAMAERHNCNLLELVEVYLEMKEI